MVIPPGQANTAFTHAWLTMQEKYLDETADRFYRPLAQIPLQSHDINGLKVLAKLGEQIYYSVPAVEKSSAS